MHRCSLMHHIPGIVWIIRIMMHHVSDAGIIPGLRESMQESYWDWENRCRNHTGIERIDAGIILGLGESMQESYRG